MMTLAIENGVAGDYLANKTLCRSGSFQIMENDMIRKAVRSSECWSIMIISYSQSSGWSMRRNDSWKSTRLTGEQGGMIAAVQHRNSVSWSTELRSSRLMMGRTNFRHQLKATKGLKLL